MSINSTPPDRGGTAEHVQNFKWHMGSFADAVHPDTPAAIVQRLQCELSAAGVPAPVVEKLTPFGMTLKSSKTSEEFRQQIASDVIWMSEVAKDLKLEAN